MTPEYKVKFKNESLLMKLLGKIFFFNKDFMTNYTTTIGSTIYFPSRQWLKLRQVSAKVVVLHELIHILDSAKYSQLLFSLMYLFPQCLALLAIPAAFFIGLWSLLFLAFLAPLPAYFRMSLELRAYTFSLYVMHRFNFKHGYNIRLETHARHYVDQFSTSYYYFMWPINKAGIEAHFTDAIARFKNGEKPFYDAKYYDAVDQLIDQDFTV